MFSNMFGFALPVTGQNGNGKSCPGSTTRWPINPESCPDSAAHWQAKRRLLILRRALKHRRVCFGEQVILFIYILADAFGVGGCANIVYNCSTSSKENSNPINWFYFWTLFRSCTLTLRRPQLPQRNFQPIRLHVHFLFYRHLHIVWH